MSKFIKSITYLNGSRHVLYMSLKLYPNSENNLRYDGVALNLYSEQYGRYLSGIVVPRYTAWQLA